MGKLERLAAARERVRRWKEAHPKSVIWQRERRYARQREERRIRGLEMVKRVRKAPEVQYAHYGETHTGDIEGVDVGYGEKEPNRGGGHGYKSLGQVDERGVGLEDGGGLEEEEETANEARTYAKFEELKRRKA